MKNWHKLHIVVLVGVILMALVLFYQLHIGIDAWHLNTYDQDTKAIHRLTSITGVVFLYATMVGMWLFFERQLLGGIWLLTSFGMVILMWWMWKEAVFISYYMTAIPVLLVSVLGIGVSSYCLKKYESGAIVQRQVEQDLLLDD